MNSKKVNALKKQGWKIGSASELLMLSPHEEAYIELKISLSKYLLKKRIEKHRSNSVRPG